MHDLTRLKELGRQRKRLMAQIEALRPELDQEIRTAAGAKAIQQKEIMEITGMSREAVRVASMSEAEREAERAKRRKPADE